MGLPITSVDQRPDTGPMEAAAAAPHDMGLDAIAKRLRGWPQYEASLRAALASSTGPASWLDRSNQWALIDAEQSHAKDLQESGQAAPSFRAVHGGPATGADLSYGDEPMPLPPSLTARSGAAPAAAPPGTFDVTTQNRYLPNEYYGMQPDDITSLIGARQQYMLAALAKATKGATDLPYETNLEDTERALAGARAHSMATDLTSPADAQAAQAMAFAKTAGADMGTAAAATSPDAEQAAAEDQARRLQLGGQALDKVLAQGQTALGVQGLKNTGAETVAGTNAAAGINRAAVDSMGHVAGSGFAGQQPGQDVLAKLEALRQALTAGAPGAPGAGGAGPSAPYAPEVESKIANAVAAGFTRDAAVARLKEAGVIK